MISIRKLPFSKTTSRNKDFFWPKSILKQSIKNLIPVNGYVQYFLTLPKNKSTMTSLPLIRILLISIRYSFRWAMIKQDPALIMQNNKSKMLTKLLTNSKTPWDPREPKSIHRQSTPIQRPISTHRTGFWMARKSMILMKNIKNQRNMEPYKSVVLKLPSFQQKITSALPVKKIRNFSP